MKRFINVSTSSSPNYMMMIIIIVVIAVLVVAGYFVYKSFNTKYYTCGIDNNGRYFLDKNKECKKGDANCANKVSDCTKPITPPTDNYYTCKWKSDGTPYLDTNSPCMKGTANCANNPSDCPKPITPPTDNYYTCKLNSDGNVILDTSSTCDKTIYNCVQKVTDCKVYCNGSKLTLSSKENDSNSYSYNDKYKCNLQCSSTDSNCSYDYNSNQPTQEFVCSDDNKCISVEGVTCVPQTNINPTFNDGRPDVYNAFACTRTPINNDTCIKKDQGKYYYCQMTEPDPTTFTSENDRKCSYNTTKTPVSNIDDLKQNNCNQTNITSDTMYCGAKTINFAPRFNYNNKIPDWYDINKTWYVNSKIDNPAENTYYKGENISNYGCLKKCSANKCDISGVPEQISNIIPTGACSNGNDCSTTTPSKIKYKCDGKNLSKCEVNDTSSDCVEFDSTDKVACGIGCNYQGTTIPTVVDSNVCAYIPTSESNMTQQQKILFCQNKTIGDKCPSKCTT